MNQEVDTSTERRIRVGQTLKIVTWVVLAVVIAVFCVVNTQAVTVDWVFGDSQNALWIVIVGSAAAGFVIGYLVSLRRR